jgi:hypothetical protein
MAAAAKLLGNVVNHKGEKIDVASHLAGKTVGLYFSAHVWTMSRLYASIS